MSSVEVDGYIRNIEANLYPVIIPSTINHLIYLYYDPVCVDLCIYYVYISTI